MRNGVSRRTLAAASAAGILLASGATMAQGQYTQNGHTAKLNASTHPAEVQKGLHLFRTKCGACHSLDLSLKTNLPPDRWAAEVSRMQAMPSARFNDDQAKAIVEFLNYDVAHRKPPIAAPAAAGESDAVSAGRAFYYAQSCDACHAIGGKGGTGGPDLSDVGQRLSADQLLQRMRDRRAGAVMPPLPPETTGQQINQLVQFLLTLKGK